MRSGSLLCLQSAEGMEPLGAFNQPAYRSYSQIRAALLNDLGKPFADYFARPDFDSDAARIGWVAHELGEPRRWVDLPADEQARLEPTRQRLLDGFAEYRAQLDSAPENSTRSNFGKLLAQAVRVPGMSYLYVLGDQPVATFWGFRVAATGGWVDPLTVAAGTVALTGMADAAAAAGAAEPVRRQRGGWWAWLLGVLLLLALMAVLAAWLLRGTFDPRALLFEPPALDLPSPAIPVPPVPAPKPDDGTLPRFRPGGTQPVGPGDGGQSEGAVQPPPIPCSGLAPCGPAAPPSFDKDGHTGTGDVPPAGGPDDAALPKADAGAPDKGPVSDKGSVPDKAPDDLPPLPKVGAPTQHGGDLQLPQPGKPGPADFMQGTWRSRSGLKLSGKPAEEFFRFNKEGRGEVVVRSRDGQTQCSGPAQATTGPGGQLSVTEPPSLSCNDGGTLPGATTTCQPQAGGASCRAVNQDGSSFGVRIAKEPQ